MEKLLEKQVKRFWDKQVKGEEIPQELYQQTVDELFDALTKGLGGVSFHYEDARNSLKGYFQSNLAQFSAAKSLTQLKFFNSLLLKQNGQLRTYAEFRNAVMRYGVLFNKNYLKTEYNTAVAAAQNARNFDMMRTNGTEFVEYKTQEDELVRFEHALLDNFTAAINDPVWQDITPPLDFNCRCYLQPGNERNLGKVETKLNSTKKRLADRVKVPKAFRNNPAISKVIFKPDLPYYIKSGMTKDGGKTIKILQAEKNYGLRPVTGNGITQSIYNKYRFNAPVALASKDDAKAWWTQQSGSIDGSITVTDITDVTVKTKEKTGRYKGFLEHVLFDNRDNREAVIANIKDVLENPDEIWQRPHENNAKEIVRYYVKYYADYPIVAMVNGNFEAYTVFAATQKNTATNKMEINTNALINLRQGNLIYNKIR